MSELVTFSIPYFQDDMTWCVPKAGLLQHLFSFLSLFDLKTWFLIFFAVILSTIIIMKYLYTTKTYHLSNFIKTFIKISSIILNQGPNLNILKWSARTLMCYIFIFSIVISSAYQSFLISFLTNPQMEIQITNIEQIYEKNMEVTGGVEVVRHLTKKGKVSSYFCFLLLKKFYSFIFKCIF